MFLDNLKSPVCLAPSSYSGQETSNIGAIWTKTVTLSASDGNSGLTFYEIDDNKSYLNRLGLPGKGFNSFLREQLNSLLSLEIPIVVSIAGSREELIEMVSILGEFYKDKIAGIELNLSCPNISRSESLNCGLIYRRCYDMVELCQGLPLIVKLPPDPARVADFALSAKLGGASAVTAVNTIPSLILSGGVIVGGISGEILKPISMRCVYEICKSVDIPVIACGGISTRKDIETYLYLGAKAVQICSAEIKEPGLTNKLAYHFRKDMDSVSDL